MTREEVDLAIEWAGREGWNPGLHDAEILYRADQDGFFAGEIDGEVVAVLSVVDYPGEYSFAGPLIVRRDWRGQGVGRQMIAFLLEQGKSRTIAWDGAADVLPAYERMGFRFAYWNHRFRGWAEGEEQGDLVPAGEMPFEELAGYDRAIFKASRGPFLRALLDHESTRSLASVKGGKLAGYGVLRKCRTGHKVGPLFADDRRTAEKILRGLISTISGEPFFLDVPEPNAGGLVLARDLRMAEILRTARMFTGTAPDIPLDKVFGTTGFGI
jgi:GNAT superfamily N-acetyltransferase